MLVLTVYLPLNYVSVNYMGKKQAPGHFCPKEDKMWCWLLKWTDVFNIDRAVKERCYRTFQSRTMPSNRTEATQKKKKKKPGHLVFRAAKILSSPFSLRSEQQTKIFVPPDVPHTFKS